MRWPGLGDPRKKRKTIRYLIILLIVGVIVGVSSSVLQGFIGQSDPREWYKKERVIVLCNDIENLILHESFDK